MYRGEKNKSLMRWTMSSYTPHQAGVYPWIACKRKYGHLQVLAKAWRHWHVCLEVDVKGAHIGLKRAHRGVHTASCALIEASWDNLQVTSPKIERLTWCTLQVANATWHQGAPETLTSAQEGASKVRQGC